MWEHLGDALWKDKLIESWSPQKHVVIRGRFEHDVDTRSTTTCSKKWTRRWRGINCAYVGAMTKAELSRLRASSPKRLARVRTHSPLAPPCCEGNVMEMLRCRRSESPRRVSTRSHRYRATTPSTRARNPREVATRFSSLEEATCRDKSFSRSHLPPSLSRRTAPHSVCAIEFFLTPSDDVFQHVPCTESMDSAAICRLVRSDPALFVLMRLGADLT